MSELHVPVVRIGKIGKHPNADTLSITQADGFPVIFRTGDFNTGDLAIYVPVDSLLPLDNPAFRFLAKAEPTPGSYHRLKALRLRGIFSRGLLVTFSVPVDQGVPAESFLGMNMAESLGIKKWEPELPVTMNSEQLSDPGFAPKYGVEHYERFKHFFQPDDEVLVTEKIHGTNARFGWYKDEFWVGSHNSWRKRDDRNVWWQVAAQYDLENRLKTVPGLIVYGEVFGHKIQDLAYGCKTNERQFRVFDIFDTNNGYWLSPQQVYDFCADQGLETVPMFYRGPYTPEAFEHLKDGPSTFDPKQIREGFVIRLRTPRHYEYLGTAHVVLKSVGEEYLLRKGGTEYH